MNLNEVEISGIISSVKISECHEGFGHLIELRTSYSLRHI